MADSITITVLDKDSGAALSGVAVEILKLSDDSTLDSGTTDISGQVVLTGLAHDTAMYITALLAGYDPYTKSGAYNENRIHLKYSSSGDDLEITSLLALSRARSGILVTQRSGNSATYPSLPVSGANCGSKKHQFRCNS